MNEIESLSWNGCSARPTPAFWAAWQADKEALKARGIHVTRDSFGEWIIFRVTRDSSGDWPSFRRDSVAVQEPC